MRVLVAGGCLRARLTVLYLPARSREEENWRWLKGR